MLSGIKTPKFMAKVELMAGIQNISGKAGNFVFKTYRRRDGKVETRMYPYKKRERRTKPSKAELGAQSLFTKRQAYVQNLRQAGDNRSLKELWKEAKEKIC